MFAAASIVVLTAGTALAQAAKPAPVSELLRKPVLGPQWTLTEVQDFVEARVPRLRPATTAGEWQEEAARIRQAVLDRVVFRGEAATWRQAKTRVERLGDGPAGDGYRLTKLRYEILPGFWVPALLYEPVKRTGKVPVHLAVNGHDRNGKAADYKQTRCINLARRGVIVLNAEWLGMGQLAGPGNRHGVMNQIDLCGSSGLAPFYLCLSRGLDVLLAHPDADPARVAVSGLSGGGWQTIFISALDPRVTLSNPVAGYSSFRTRVHYHKDLGDSEQTPTDLATVADYTHLTALRAPRPTLLTYNAKDDCCFEAGYTLPPLENAARPVYDLFGAGKALRTHVNWDPGDHNFGRENREALYRLVGDFFFPDDRTYRAAELDCKAEIRSAAELTVPLPDDNLTLNALAKRLAGGLPRAAGWPASGQQARSWQDGRRRELAAVVRLPDLRVREATEVGREEKAGVRATYWRLRLGDWTVPVVELVKGNPTGTTVLVGDAGRAALGDRVQEFLNTGQRVLAVDLFGFGEARPPQRDWLWALLVATVGERPLGVAAGQLGAVAAWASERFQPRAVRVAAGGPRTTTVALVAAACRPEAIAALELTDPPGSLRELIEQDRTVEQTPELFCFGLLEQFDVVPIAGLVAPRPVAVRKPSDLARQEFGRLASWYRTLGSAFDPFK
jgi:hypothetical protein